MLRKPLGLIEERGRRQTGVQGAWPVGTPEGVRREGEDVDGINSSKENVPFIKFSSLIKVAEHQKCVIIMRDNELLNFDDERDEKLLFLLRPEVNRDYAPGE